MIFGPLNHEMNISRTLKDIEDKYDSNKNTLALKKFYIELF